VSSENVASYGPAMSAVMYDEIRGVAGNAHVAEPSPCFLGSGVGELETTFHGSGAVTVNWNVAFRSGCSNTANMRRESGTSNCEYR
jgi:hypothetical protein